jgi:MarR family 2-MHQ and catechol resistance regulon transcriptional repressor
MNKRLPDSNAIENVAKVVRTTDFLYLASFADMVNRFIDIIFRKDKINRLRLGAMNILIARGGSLMPSQLARLTFRSKHTITKVIDSLEKDGFVKRDRSRKDRRAIRVKITSAGLDFVMQALNIGEPLTQQVMSSLDNDERKILVNLVQRLRRAMVGIIASR